MQIHRFDSKASLGQTAAEHISRIAAQAVTQRGRFSVAFSGGSLPALVCPPLLSEPLRSQIDWSAWHIFFADERCVPYHDPESNYRLLREQLLRHVTIPQQQIHAVNEALFAHAAADEYARRIAQFFAAEPDTRPRFDLVLLGMGPDGHTASLFPHHPLLRERHRWVGAITDSPKPPPERITLTLPVLNAAQTVVFVVTGAAKAPAIAQVTQPDAGDDESCPARLVHPASGDLHWYLDAAAAANLPAE